MALGLTSTPQGVTKGNDMGGAVSSAVNTVGNIGQSAIDATSDVGSALAEPFGGWTNVRDTTEAAGVVAGNYFLPGSGLVTSQFVSEGAQDALGSDLGKVAMVGSGDAGVSAGNLSNYGSLYDSAVGATGGTAGSTGGGLTAGSSGTGLQSTGGLGIGTGTSGIGLTGTAETAGIGAGLGGTAGSSAAGTGLLGGAMNWAAANPLQAASLGLTAAKALGGSSTPSSSTSTTGIDPEMKAAYLRNLEEARGVSASLGQRQFAAFPTYSNEVVNQYMNPYQQQVIDASLGDIERQRQQQQLRDRAAAVQAKAFGGSRQGVAEALTNEAFSRTAANTAAQLRSQGFTQAQQIALQQEEARRQYEQQKLDAIRNLGLERLNISSSALGIPLANLGGTQTTPLYQNTTASALGGALGGASLGKMIGGTANPEYAGYGAAIGGLLGLA